MTASPAPQPELVAELRHLIGAARQRAAVAVNAGLTHLHSHAGDHVSELFQHVGIVPTLSRQLGRRSIDPGSGHERGNQ